MKRFLVEVIMAGALCFLISDCVPQVARQYDYKGTAVAGQAFGPYPSLVAFYYIFCYIKSDFSCFI